MKVRKSLDWKFIIGFLILLLIGSNKFTHAQDNRWLNPTRPNNCEDALALLDTAAVDALTDVKSSIIVIARLGDREKSQKLNQRRLEAAVDRLKEKARNNVVGATGGRVQGLGRLELYVGGKLLYVIAYPRNGIIDCRDLG